MSPLPPDPVELGELEWKQEPERSMNLTSGELEACIRILYRRPPARRWRSFLLFSEYTLVGAPPEVVSRAIAYHERGAGEQS